jgi:hypothetical protein
MFVAGKAKRGDKARTRPVWLKDGRRLIGYIYEPDGVGGGYVYKMLGRTHASAKRYPTIKACKEGLGTQL